MEAKLRLVKSVLFMFGQVKISKDRSSQAGTGQVKSRQVKSSPDTISNQVSSSHIKLG